MRKKFLMFMVMAITFLNGPAVVYSTTSGEGSGYDAVIYDSGITFSAVSNADGSVTTNWSKYEKGGEFSFYKVVRSQENANPVYPDDGYIYYTGNVDELSYTDSDVPEGTSHYRICQVASPARYCSQSVVTITKTASAATVEPVVTETTTSETVTTEAPENTAEESVTTEMIDVFEDVPVDYWAVTSIQTLAEKGIVDSGEGVYFRPESSITRAEFLKLIMETYYADSVGEGEACFNDVNSVVWYSPYVCGAKAEQIVTGYGNNTFRPNNSITRAEATAMLVKALRLPEADESIITFDDVWASWQRQVVAAALDKGIISGYSADAFGPNDLMLRAQGAKILCNALTSIEQPLEGTVIVTETQQTVTETNTETTVTENSEDPVVLTDAIIINHTNTDLGAISSDAIAAAKSRFKIAYGHTSHGGQITTGINVIRGIADLYSFNSDGSGGALYYNEGLFSGDLGSGDWAGQTRSVLNRSGNNINMVMWSWCGQVSGMSSDDIATYLNTMNALEADFPNVTFVYMTGHLDGTGESGALHRNNEQIRNFVRANNKVLFDFADIESYDPDGNYYLNRGANDNNDYDGGNWAREWCSAHGDSELCAANSCAHSQSLNCNLKGRAFWSLMARLGSE